MEEPVLHVIVIGFHHKKGCQVEFAYPPLIEGNSVESHELPEEWKHIPSLALPDGAHNYISDTVYFVLPGRKKDLHTVYGVSCYRQMAAEDLKNKTADVTRSTVQKSVCVLSRLPLFGLIKAKLELITHAYFDECDFSQVSLLEQTFNTLNLSLTESLLEGSQAFLGLSARDLVIQYKHKAIIIFKLLMLERRILVFGSPVESLGHDLLGFLSLFPGMLESGLQQACNQWSQKKLSPTLTMTRVDSNQSDSDQFMEIRYHSSTPENPVDEVLSHMSSGSALHVGASGDSEYSPLDVSANAAALGETQIRQPMQEAPISPTISRDGEDLCEHQLFNDGRLKVQPNASLDNQISKSIVEVQGDTLIASTVPELDKTSKHDRRSLNSCDNDSDREEYPSPRNSIIETASTLRSRSRSCSQDQDKPAVHNAFSRSNSRKEGSADGDIITENKDIENVIDKLIKMDLDSKFNNEDDSPLANIESITHVEAVQKKSVNVLEDSNTTNNKDGSVFTNSKSKVSDLPSLAHIKERLLSDDMIDDLASPESISLIDQEDCFSWEQDRVQLSIDHVFTFTSDTVGSNPSNPDEESAKSRTSSTGEGGREATPTPNPSQDVNSDTSNKKTENTLQKTPLDFEDRGDSPSKQKKSLVIKNKLSAALHKVTPKSKTKDEKSENKGMDFEGKIMMSQDDSGYPLTLFTHGSVCYPYLSLQYHDILTDVNIRSFFIGATNILFKQRRQLVDAIIEVEDGKLDVRDRELQRQLSLTTADLRFGEYLVNTVTEDRPGTYDGTEWEGSDEWIRAQFRHYLNSLLSTVLTDDAKMVEDFGASFVSAWKTTHNFHVWSETSHPIITVFPPGHPFQGNLSMTDVKTKFNHTLQNSERGRKISAAAVQTGKYVVHTGKVVGGALTSARSAVSGWFSSWRGGDKSDTIAKTNDEITEDNVANIQEDVITSAD